MTVFPSVPLEMDAGELASTVAVQRASRLSGAVLGAPAAVTVARGPGLGEAVFSGDEECVARLPASLRAALGDALAFAAVPLPGPASADDELVMFVRLDAARRWTELERSALAEVASALGAELEAQRRLAIVQQDAEALKQHVMRDGLTSLPNRALFLDRLGHAVERARRHREFRFAVLLIDLDRFKGVNDSLGVQVGDEVLLDTARRLTTCIRDEDTIARLSGDEFAVLLESLSDDSDAGRVADRMLGALVAPVSTREGQVFPSASIGIALSSSGLDEGNGTHARMLQRAGVAMSRAKAAGRGRYEMFDRTLQARAVARLRMETDLRGAVERQEFELFYQPLVSLASGQITELEALLRWRHPTRGLVAPLDFLPLAEETGLITRIGAWVLAEACRQMLDWQRRYPRTSPLSLSVNLSVKQFAQPDFVRHVSEIILASGLDPHCLKLEITESVAIDDPERTRGMLEELRALGVRMYLDDFGTGYSSLGHLHQLSLDAIKIDRSFVMHMEEPMHLQLVHTVRDLARNIGVTVIAEGVETEAQLAVLRRIGCESAQGYLFSRPVPVSDVDRLLERDPRW